MGLPSPACVPQGLLRQTCFCHCKVCTCPERVTYTFRQQGSPGPQTLSAHETILLLLAVPVSPDSSLPAAASISPPAPALPALPYQQPTLGEDQVATQPAVPLAVKAGGCSLSLQYSRCVLCGPLFRSNCLQMVSGPRIMASLRPPTAESDPQPEAQLLCELRFHL